MSNEYGIVEKWVRWFIYGVVVSFIPFLAAAVYKWWIGYEFTLLNLEYVPSFVAITISFAGNVCGYTTNIEKEFNPKCKRAFSFLSIATLLACVFFYALLLNTEESAQIKESIQIDEETSITLSAEGDVVVDEEYLSNDLNSIAADRIIMVAYISGGLFIINFFMGGTIEGGLPHRKKI